MKKSQNIMKIIVGEMKTFTKNRRKGPARQGEIDCSLIRVFFHILVTICKRTFCSE